MRELRPGSKLVWETFQQDNQMPRPGFIEASVALGRRTRTIQGSEQRPERIEPQLYFEAGNGEVYFTGARRVMRVPRTVLTER